MANDRLNLDELERVTGGSAEAASAAMELVNKDVVKRMQEDTYEEVLKPVIQELKKIVQPSEKPGLPEYITENPYK